PNATNGLLRISNGYRLLFDFDLSAYYLTWSASEDELLTGAILIVGGELDPPVGAPLDRCGAAHPIRVSRIVTRAGETRAYLVDAPRVGGRPMLVNHNSNVSLRRVYSLRREVECTDPDGIVSRWQVRPVLYQTLDVQ